MARPSNVSVSYLALMPKQPYVDSPVRYLEWCASINGQHVQGSNPISPVIICRRYFLSNRFVLDNLKRDFFPTANM